MENEKRLSAEVLKGVMTRAILRINKTETCWMWTGETNPAGYGFISGQIAPRRAIKVMAHRLIYQHFRGPIPEGLVPDHLCRVHPCVNPDHLEIVTEKINILRGTSSSAVNANKTHCVRGHELSDANVYLFRLPVRECRICSNLRRRSVHLETADARK